MKKAAHPRRLNDPRDLQQYLILANQQRCLAALFNRKSKYLFDLMHIREEIGPKVT